MQSDEPYHSYAQPVQTPPPFDYVPDSSTLDDYAHPHDSAVSARFERPLDDNPDDFYRPFAEQQSRPDIILQDSAYLMAGARRKAGQPNGSVSKPASPASSTHRSSARAASGSSTLNSTRSVPSLTGASRLQNGSIKDRIKQFDQGTAANPAKGAAIRSGRSRTPSSSRHHPSSFGSPGQETKYHSPLQKQSSSTQRLDHGSLRQRSGHRNGPARPPLFGEVVDSVPGTPDAGYGISDITTPHTDLSESMRRPKAMFSRSRSQSEVDLAPQLEPLQIPSPTNEQCVAHHRSQSDMSPPPQIMLSPSRIPVRTRRNSDIGPSRSTSPLESGSGAGTEEEQQSRSKADRSNRARRHPPATLSSRRYSPKRATEPNQSLSAVVRAPPPKLSPPLRSSRPRQPVTTATTSASRARTSGKLAISNGSENARSSPVDKKPKPVIPGGVDVAARRARLQHKLQADGVRDAKSGQQEVKPSHTKESVKAAKSQDESKLLLQPTVFRPELAVPELSVSTDEAAQHPSAVEFDTPSTEFDESPVLGRNVASFLGAHHSQPSSLSRVQSTGEDEADAVAQNNLLSHIMTMRQGSASTTPRTQAVEDFLSERDDSETIQIILGATPILPDSTWNRDMIDAKQDIPEERGEYCDSRSSVRPEDSVSMVFRQQQEPQHTAKLASRYPVPPIPQGLTLDSEARSQINHVLDQYREGLVTPEMAYGFQRQVEQISPLLPQHRGWTSREATENYLQVVLESTESEVPTPVEDEPADEPPEPVHGSRPTFDEPSSAEFDEEQGGTAIIYAQPELYRPISGDSFQDRLNKHSHSASNSTLRPSHVDEVLNVGTGVRDSGSTAAVPSNDGGTRLGSVSGEGPQLPEISTAGEGLGLSMELSHPLSPMSPLPPARAPPPPPPWKEGHPAMVARYPAVVSPGIYTPSRQHYVDPFSSGPTSPTAMMSPRNPSGDGRLQYGSQSAKTSLELSREKDSLRGVSIDSKSDGLDSRPQAITGQRDQERELSERKNCIKELVDTEHSYSQDMTIMEDIYMGTASSVLSDEDRRVLFGNLDQVRAFSVLFLDALRHASASIYTIPRENRWNFRRGSYGTSYSGTTETSGSGSSSLSDRDRVALDEKTTIGQAFLNHLGQIEKIYGDWIVKTNDAANTRLKEIQQRPGVKYWLDECHTSAKDITSAWSLDALIIKPAQRLMKYPLLLQNLIKCTSRDHPDYSALKQANEALVNITHRINEAKKRAELVEQAMNRKRKESDPKVRVGKLLNRRTEKLKQQVGISNVADDQEYEAIAQKFGGHFFQLQIVMRDVEKYLEDMQNSIEWLHMFLRSLVQYSQLESQERWPEYESNWIRLSQAVQEILEIALQDHITQVRSSVIDPILTLWKLHVGPQKMMQKRKKRLVDHVRYKTVVQRGEKPDKKLQLEEDQFNAVNETLKDELPKLYALTKKLVEACLTNFVDIQAQWQSILKRKIEPFVDSSHLLPTDLTQYIAVLQSTFNQDLAEWETRIKSLGVCNGSTLAEAQNFLSPTTTFTQEDSSSSHKRPSTVGSGRRTLSLSSEQASHSSPNVSRISDNFAAPAAFSPSPLLGSFPLPDGISQAPSAVRTGAGSALSSRGPSTPHSLNPLPTPSGQHPNRPSTTSERPYDLNSVPRLDLDINSGHEFGHDDGFLMSNPNHGQRETDRGASHHVSDERFSGMFHSALPMSESPRSSSPSLTEGDAKVLFLAASLFEFNIDGSRREAGYPYLRYVPGEIFDVIGQKGELWLAKNQDDPSGLIGWIWEKHFARILPDEA